MYLVQPYMLTCRWLERCFHTVPSLLVLLHPGFPDGLGSFKKPWFCLVKLSFERGLFIPKVTDTNRIPSAFFLLSVWRLSVPIPSNRVNRLNFKSWRIGCFVHHIVRTGLVIRQLFSDTFFLKIGWPICHTFDRSDRKTEVKRRKSVVTHPLILSVGRSNRTSSSFLIYRQGFADQSSSFQLGFRSVQRQPF